MSVFNLNFYDLSYASTTASTFSDNGGYQFNLGTDTITLQPGATSQALSINDTTNTTFDDDDLNQTLADAYELNGVKYDAGTIIEAEYDVVVEDSLGNQYTLQFISLDNDAWNITGFTVQGDPPPYGEALTVVQATDYSSGAYAYSTSTPSCFGPDTRFLLAEGHQKPARALRKGDRLRCHDGSTAAVAMILHSQVPLDTTRDLRPVRLRAHALGQGLPDKGLTLSAQHRVYCTKTDSLMPALALTRLPRIGRQPPLKEGYVHIVLSRHAVIFANGLPCESFWPGPVALSLLPAKVAQRVRQVMGTAPPPAKPFLTLRQARESLPRAQ